MDRQVNPRLIVVNVRLASSAKTTSNRFRRAKCKEAQPKLQTAKALARIRGCAQASRASDPADGLNDGKQTRKSK
jgi:hypothetical protein